MKNFTRAMALIAVMLISAPAYSMQAIQIFECSFDSEGTTAKVQELASSWLKAAKTINGGSNMHAYVRFPISADMGESDFKFVIVFPTFEEWGQFTDAYEGSEASKVDEELDAVAECADSEMWEGLEVQ